MLKNLLSKKKLQEGFTIIEVMIVLAIAGLILVVVLIAIPQLQRNQRNENRRSIASRIVTEINSFAGNNNGDYPEPIVAATTSAHVRYFGAPDQAFGFFDRYLGCDSAATPVTCDANINDPQTGLPVGIPTASGEGSSITTVAGAGAAPTLGDEAGSIAYATGVVCDGEVMTTSGANNRSFAFQMRLEGGAIFCSDNS